MKPYQSQISFLCRMLVVLVAAAGLVACGGGGGGGSASAPLFTGIDTQAEVDDDNAGEISGAAAEAAAYTINVETTDGALPIAIATGGNASLRLRQVLHDLGVRLSGLAAGNSVIGAVQTFTITSSELNEGLPEPMFCGGSVRMRFDPDTQFGTTEITYNNLCMILPDFLSGSTGNAQYRFNGSYTMTLTQNSSTINSTMRVTYPDGSVQTMFYTMECDGDFFNCEFSSDYIGADGSVYRVRNVSLTGNEFTGYNLTATFYHPDHGYVELQTSGIKFNCSETEPGWQPGEGTMTLVASNGTVTVTFDDCSGYSWSFDDGDTVISDTVSWAN